VKQVYGSIICHAWNADRTKLAVCPNNNEVLIFEKEGTNWVEKFVLAEHDAVITGIDWAPVSNRIVTCSHDRNAYVWTYQDGTWKPTLVILRIAKAATSVKWAPNEKKFAVSSSAKCVSVCYFDKENDWWSSRHFSKHKSTVLSLAWHPNSIYLLTGSSDNKCRIFNAFVKGEDTQDKFGQHFGDSKNTFGEILSEYSASSWVHNVAWARSGTKLAFLSHDSTIHFVDVTGGLPGTTQALKLNILPLSDLLFITENSLVAGGHDYLPYLFENKGDSWALSKELTQEKKAAAKSAGATRDAFNKFSAKVETGTDSREEQIINSVHQNSISQVLPFAIKGDTVVELTTSGLDGKIVLWKL
jgi:actin related protein 2/3 complex subunit 1A/1B